MTQPDIQFKDVKFQLSEIEHEYGKNVHILSDPFLLSHLAQLCAENTTQPAINELIETIYRSLLFTVANAEFPKRFTAMRTRMALFHKEGIYQGQVIDPETAVVSVNLARAGTVPSHICYSALNYFMNPTKVRQDHISIARQTGDNDEVTGSSVSGHKIGGPIKDAIVLFPDPMGATGSTLVKAIDLYKREIGNEGQPMKWISIHCIVTPEYLKKIKDHHPDLTVYAVRLDRGLSSDEVLGTVPGSRWSEEKGLNEKQYIVPGGGGFGEILNNAYV